MRKHRLRTRRSVFKGSPKNCLLNEIAIVIPLSFVAYQVKVHAFISVDNWVIHRHCIVTKWFFYVWRSSTSCETCQSHAYIVYNRLIKVEQNTLVDWLAGCMQISVAYSMRKGRAVLKICLELT